MSILAAAEPVSTAHLAFGALLCAFGLGLAYAIGAFRGERLRIDSPVRVARDEPIGPVVLGAFLGLAVWLGLQAVYGVYLAMTQQTPAAGAPPGGVTFGARDYAVLGTVPFIGGLITLMAADVLTSRGQLPRKLGWSLDRLPIGLLWSLLGAVIVLPLIFGASLWVQATYQAIGYEHPTAHEMLKVLAESRDPVVRAALIFGATILAPLFEEFFFRGHVQTILLRLFSPPATQAISTPDAPAAVVARPPSAAGRWAAIALAAALFAVLHPAWTWPLIFILALGMGYAYERTGNLWVPVFIHLLFNTFNTIVTLVIQPQFERAAQPL